MDIVKIIIAYLNFVFKMVISRQSLLVISIFSLLGSIITATVIPHKICNLLFSIFIASMLSSLITKIIYVKLGVYLVLNRFAGILHMDVNWQLFKLMKKCTRLKSRRMYILDELANEFIKEILQIPKKTAFCPFILYRKSIKLQTNEIIYKKFYKEIELLMDNKRITIAPMKNSIILEKVIFVSPLKILFDKSELLPLLRKVNKYKIEIPLNLLESMNMTQEKFLCKRPFIG